MIVWKAPRSAIGPRVTFDAAAGFAILVLVATIVVLLVTTYNAVVAMGQRIDKAWANIDVILKQRHDELPRLVEAVRGLMGFEREVLEEVTRLRAGYRPDDPDRPSGCRRRRHDLGRQAPLGRRRGLPGHQEPRERAGAAERDRPPGGHARRPARALQRHGLPLQHAHPDRARAPCRGPLRLAGRPFFKADAAEREAPDATPLSRPPGGTSHCASPSVEAIDWRCQRPARSRSSGRCGSRSGWPRRRRGSSSASGIELRLADGRHAGAGIAATAQTRGRVDRPDADAVRRRSADPAHRDRPVVVPDVQPTAPAGQAAIDHSAGIARLALAEGLLLEGDQPADEVVAIGRPRMAKGAGHAMRPGHSRELEDALAHVDAYAAGRTLPSSAAAKAWATRSGRERRSSGAPARSSSTGATAPARYSVETDDLPWRRPDRR